MDVVDGNGSEDGSASGRKSVAGAESKGTRKRKPYQPPAFRYERVFETMALACGKVGSIQAQCRSMNSAS
jgi:hypothetical protein